MNTRNLGKLITPSAVTELDGVPSRLLAFAHRIAGRRRAAFVVAGPLSTSEKRLFHRTADHLSHTASTTAAARWHVNAVLACRQADVIVALVTAPDPADRTAFALWLQKEAQRTGCAVLLLRRENDACLPSPAVQRFHLTAEDFFLTTEYRVTPAAVGLPSTAPCPVAEFGREFTFPDLGQWLAVGAAKAVRFLSNLLEPVFTTA